jgi:hypothetical protein
VVTIPPYSQVFPSPLYFGPILHTENGKVMSFGLGALKEDGDSNIGKEITFSKEGINIVDIACGGITITRFYDHLLTYFECRLSHACTH